MRTIVLFVCLSFAIPAFARDAVELTAPATATVSADGEVDVVQGDPDVVPAVEEAVPAGEAGTTDAIAVAETSPAPVVEQPSTPEEVVDAGKKVADAWKTKSLPAIAGAVIFLLLALFRLPALGSLTSKIPPRVRVLVVMGLSLLAGAMNAVALGAPWGQSLTDALYAATAAVFANELIVETIFGKRYKTSGAAPKN